MDCFLWGSMRGSICWFFPWIVVVYFVVYNHHNTIFSISCYYRPLLYPPLSSVDIIWVKREISMNAGGITSKHNIRSQFVNMIKAGKHLPHWLLLLSGFFAFLLYIVVFSSLLEKLLVMILCIFCIAIFILKRYIKSCLLHFLVRSTKFRALPVFLQKTKKHLF